MDKLKRAMQHVQENNLEKAMQLFISYTEEHPTDPVGFINLGNGFVRLGKWQEAERFFLKAIELDQNSGTAYYSLGNLYYKEQMYDYAEKMFTKALSLGLEDSDTYYMIGLTHLSNEQLMLALPFLQRAVELDDEIEKLFQYGLTLARLKYYHEAKEVFLQLLNQDPHHADTLYNLGVLAVHEQNRNGAQTYFSKALRVNKSHTLAKKAKASLEKGLQKDQ